MSDCVSLLSVEGLSKSFGVKRAVENLSFHIRGGSVVGLLGPNGSGKTSALGCIVGVVQPSSGTVTICGNRHDDPQAKECFGFLADDLPMPDSLSGHELLSFYRRLHVNYDDELALQLMDIMDLTSALGVYFGNYSHGMKRKMQLALALGHRPGLLILDEPMRGLDPEASYIMNAIIYDYKKTGRAVLMATHDLSAASATCDHVIIMADGRMVLEGSPDAIMTAHDAGSLEEVFITATGLSSALGRKTAALEGLLHVESSEGSERLS